MAILHPGLSAVFLGLFTTLVAAANLQAVAERPSNYGVWHARLDSFDAPTTLDPSLRFLYAFLNLDDGILAPTFGALDMKAPYDIGDTRVVCWIDEDFDHPVTQEFEDIEKGWHFISDSASTTSDNNTINLPGLDILGDGLVELGDGIITRYMGLDFATDREGESDDLDEDDITDLLIPFFDRAAEADADVFVFGVRWQEGEGRGMQMVRRNQGHPEGDGDGDVDVDGAGDNWADGDGGVFVRYLDDDGKVERWEALFMAFVEQAVETDADTGEALPGSKTFGDVLSY